MDKENIFLDKMLSKVGDLGLKRRIVKLLEYLDIKDGLLVFE